MKLRLTTIVFMTAAAMPVIVFANTRPPGAVDDIMSYPFTRVEILGTGVIAVLSLLVILASYFLRKSAGFSEEGVIRLVSLILIVSGTLFLVTLGFGPDQIAPALGILGTIAGYMLGRSSKSDDEKKKSDP